MSRNRELREEVVAFIKQYFKKEGKVPTIKEIVKEIKGVNTSNFYIFFPGRLAEACEEAGVPVPESRLKKTQKAHETRMKSEKDFPIISLDPDLSKKLWVVSHLEEKDHLKVIYDLLEQDRLFRTEYNLKNQDLSNFTQFLKDAEKRGLNKKQIINSIIKFTKIGLENLTDFRFNKLMDLVKFMISKNLQIEDLYTIFLSRNEVYRKGYSKCVDYAGEEILKELNKIDSIELLKALSISEFFKANLILRTPDLAPGLHQVHEV